MQADTLAQAPRPRALWPGPPSRRRRPPGRSGRRRRCTSVIFDPTLGYPGEGPRPPPGGATAVVTANTNSASTLLSDVLPGVDSGNIVLAQETRLDDGLRHGESPLDRFRVRALAAGWRACLTPAYPTGRGGHGGGVAVLWPPHLDVCPIGEVAPGRAVAVAWTSARLGEVVLVSVYGVAGGGVAGNRALWSDLAAFLARTGKPFVLGGDFNVSPAEAALLAAELAMPVLVYAAGMATYHGVVSTELDFFVVHRRVAAAAAPAVRLRLDLPLAPHRAVELRLDAAGARTMVPVMRRPRPPPAARPVVGPPWSGPAHIADLSRIADQAAALAATALGESAGLTRPWGGSAHASINALWEDWFVAAERELTATTGSDVTLTRAWEFPQRELGDAVGLARPSGRRPMPSRLLVFCRGRLLDARAALLRAAGQDPRAGGARARLGAPLPPAEPPAAGPARAAAAAALHTVLAGAFRAARGAWIDDLLRAAPAAGADVVSLWRSRLRGTPRLLRADAQDFRQGIAGLEDLAERCRLLADQWATSEWALRRKDWASTVAECLSGPARRGHRMSRLAEPAPPGDGTIAAQMAVATTSWSALWLTGPDPPSFADQPVPVGPPTRAADIREAARTFALGTAAPDGCSPRHFGLLSDGALNAMSALFRLAEIGGTYADCLEQLVIRLIPKRSGGYRPICLFRSVVRLHLRVLADRARSWERSGPAAGHAFNNSPGRHILDTTYRECVRHALCGNGAAAEVLLDLTKAFELVDRNLLWAAAVHWGYPLAPLRLTLAAYGWTRRLVGDYSIASPSLRATRGIAAGSPFATFELKALLLGVVLPVLTARPGLAISVHVDDFTVPARAASPGAVLDVIVPAVLDIAQRLEGVGLSIAPDKTEIVATSGTLASDLRAALRAAAEQAGIRAPVGPDLDPPVSSVRKLGVDLTLLRAHPLGRRRGRRPRGHAAAGVPANVLAPVKAGRLATHARRLARCRMLFGKTRFRNIMRTGLLPAALHAPEFSTFTPGELHALRVGVLTAEGLAAPGIAYAAAWALLPRDGDPAFMVHAAPLLRFNRECWEVAGRNLPSATPPPDLLTPRELVDTAALAGGDPPPGPVAALRAGLEWFRLSLHGTVLQRGQVSWADLARCPPALLRRALRELADGDTQAWVDERHADPDRADLPPVNLRAVRAAAGRASAAEARVLAHLVGGTTRTFQHAHNHGAPCAPACPACGAPDSVAHRALACPAGGPAPPLHEGAVLTRLGLPRWPAAAFPPPAAGPLYGTVAAYADGRRVFSQGSAPPRFCATAPVYTDGSGLHPATPYALAAGAAVQPLPRTHWPPGHAGAEGCFAVAGVVLPPSAPATSYGGEVAGLLLAARCAARGDGVANAAPSRLRLVTDCLNAVRRLEGLRHRPPAGSDPWGGFYRDFARALPPGEFEVSKTRAHRSRSKAVADDDLQAWLGNDVADWTAGRTLAVADATHRAARANAAQDARSHRALVQAIIRRLLAVRAAVGVPPARPRRIADGLRAARYVLPEEQRHIFRWVPARQRYQCERCHRLVTRLPPPANRCLRMHPALRTTLAAAGTSGHRLHICAVQGRMAGVMAICVACGAYGAERCHLLRRQCAGVLLFRAFSVRAVAQRRHPHCRASFIERVWTLDEAPDGAGLAVADRPAPLPPGLPPEPRDVNPAAVAAADPDEGDEWSLGEILAFHGEDPEEGAA